MSRPSPTAVRIIQKLCQLGYSTSKTSNFQERLRRNIEGKERYITKKEAWNGILIAILTTQQKSGRGSKPAQILQSEQLSWQRVNQNPRLISHHINGFRFNQTKRDRLKLARDWLNDYWSNIRGFQKKLDGISPNHHSRYVAECEAADFLLGRNGGLDGVGPKQARNFWQYLGYTVWTIPLDSRVQKILREPPFSIDWPRSSLSAARYQQIECSIVELCKAVRQPKAYPVLLDSALFNMEGLIRDLAGFPRGN